VHFSAHRDSISKDSISKDSVESPVFRPRLGTHVVSEYSEVVNCAPPSKAVRYKSSSSRKKSSSSFVTEKLEKAPAPLALYETIAMVSESVN